MIEPLGEVHGVSNKVLSMALANLLLAADPQRALWIATALVAFSDSALALEQTAAPTTCDTPAHHQMDFWLGDWQVFDAATRQLVAFDRVEKRYEGCVLQETLTFVTDMYRRPGAKVRLAGIAVNGFDGERWLQMWADNQWGAILLRW